VQDVSKTAPIGPELVALVTTVMLSFQGGAETISPFRDNCLITSRVPEKYLIVRTKMKQ
jgi:hypothetical protein